MAHANARLNVYGGQLIIICLGDGWTQAEAAEAMGVCRATVTRWAKRYR